MEALKTLRSQLLTAVNFDLSERVDFDIRHFQEEFQTFYLEFLRYQDEEIISSQCENFLKHFIQYILAVKQQAAKSVPNTLTQIQDALKILTEKIVLFIDKLNEKSNENGLMQDMIDIMAYISNINAQCATKSSLAEFLLRQKNFLENIYEDLNKNFNEEVVAKAKIIIWKTVVDWEKDAQKVVEGEVGDPAEIMEKCKKISSDVDYLVASV